MSGKSDTDIIASHYSYSSSIDKQGIFNHTMSLMFDVDVVTVEHYSARDFNRFLLKPEKPMKSFL